MENFKFMHQNYAATTTQLYVNSGTLTAPNLIDRDRTTRWISVGYDSNTTSVIRISLTAATAVSRIFVCGCNWSAFRVFYDGITANVFNPDIQINTQDADNLFFEFATQTVASVTFEVMTTAPISNEKYATEIYLGNDYFELSRNPDASNYNPRYYKKGRELEMADGGIVSIFVGNKFQADISLNYVEATIASYLSNLYGLHNPFYFVPFAVNGFTTVSLEQWDGQAYETNWTGNYNFLKIADNNIINGFVGEFTLAETPL
jgi:hypothetical protein